MNCWFISSSRQKTEQNRNTHKTLDGETHDISRKRAQHSESLGIPAK